MMKVNEVGYDREDEEPKIFNKTFLKKLFAYSDFTISQLELSNGLSRPNWSGSTCLLNGPPNLNENFSSHL